MLFPYYDENSTRTFPYFTLGILVVNVAALLWLSSMPPRDQQVAVAHHGFVPKRMAQLLNPRLRVQVKLPTPQVGRNARGPIFLKQDAIDLPANRGEVISSLFSSMFLHAGWFHLISNMWFLWIFGNNVEDHLGHLVYGFFYLFGGLLAISCHWFIDPQNTMPVVGASGAVAAVLGAYAITYPSARIRCVFFLVIFLTTIVLPAWIVLGFWFFQQLIFGLTSLNNGIASVAWWAHIGGFAAGVGLMPLLSKGPRSIFKEWEDEYRDHFG